MIHSYECRNFNSKYVIDKKKQRQFQRTININIFQDRNKETIDKLV